MNNTEINLKLGNIELRKYKGFGTPEIDGNIANTYEFVKWTNKSGKEYCYVVAFADTSSEGCGIRTVGSRPWELDADDFDDYNKLVRIFFNVMNSLNDK